MLRFLFAAVAMTTSAAVPVAVAPAISDTQDPASCADAGDSADETCALLQHGSAMTVQRHQAGAATAPPIFTLIKELKLVPGGVFLEEPGTHALVGEFCGCKGTASHVPCGIDGSNRCQGNECCQRGTLSGNKTFPCPSSDVGFSGCEASGPQQGLVDELVADFVLHGVQNCQDEKGTCNVFALEDGTFTLKTPLPGQVNRAVIESFVCGT